MTTSNSAVFGRTPVDGPKPKAAGAASTARGHRIEHRIGIKAPAAVVWGLIHDLEGWGRWNPIYPQMSGVVRIGEPVKGLIALPGMKPREFGATILAWVRNEQLQWHVPGRLSEATRYIEIEPLSPESCFVANGEVFGGLMGPLIVRLLGGRIHTAFRQMSEALKTEAEARAAKK
jgi:hypothetical protein